jgi:hypothetical protein
VKDQNVVTRLTHSYREHDAYVNYEKVMYNIYMQTCSGTLPMADRLLAYYEACGLLHSAKYALCCVVRRLLLSAKAAALCEGCCIVRRLLRSAKAAA